MPLTEQDESQQVFLERQIKERLSHIQVSIQFYRHRHYRYQSSAVVLSALITILSGLKLVYLPVTASAKFPLYSTDVVLILGAVSTVLAAFGAFFSPQQSWYLNVETYAKMRGLQAKLEFSERSPSFEAQKQEILDQCFAEYQKILDEYNQNWKNLRQTSK